MLWFEQSWLLLLVDVSVKSLALASVAWLALSLLRVQNANVRHRVWSAVLLAMIALPLLVPVTPSVPIPAWMIPQFPVASSTEQLQSVEPAAVLDDPLPVDAELAPSTTASHMEQFEAGGFDKFAAETTYIEVLADHTPATLSSTGNLAALDQPAVASTVPSSRAGNWFSLHWSITLFCAYGAIVFVFAGRILIGVLGTHRIVARSVLVEADYDCEFGAKLYESSDLAVPLTVGFLRPKILLPDTWRSWSQTKLESVIAHETAHIGRGDYMVTLFAEFNRAIHWFNPLSWMLRRWLSELAEQNCDDAVIASTGERAQYARHLLEVATTLQDRKARVAWAGVAMARKPNVESRIDAILDAKRPLARRLGVAGVVLLIATTLPAILLAAALRPADEAPAATDTASAVVAAEEASDENEEQSKEQGKEQGKDSKTFRGTVVDPDGKPVANALVCAENYGYNQMEHKRFHTKLATTNSGADGAFSLVVPDTLRGVNHVVAHAEGLAPAIAKATDFTKNDSVKMQLAKNRPIVGRVLDTEGNPVADVKVQIRHCVLPKSEKAVADWIANEKPELFAGINEQQFMYYNDARMNATRFPGVAVLQGRSPGMPQPVTTDADGNFRINGLGENRCAELELSGSSIATRRARVVVRKMKSILAFTQSDEGDYVHHGSSPRLIAHPTQPIVGQVVESGSGEPLANMEVKISRIGKSSWTNNWPGFKTKTDAEGRFRLEGATLGGGHRITVVPKLERPFFKTDLDLPESSGSAPLECRVEMPRCKWIVGKVLDETGEPVRATLNFYPYRDNEFAEQFKNYDPKIVGSVPDNVFHTNDKGEFRIRAIPGRGVLAAHISDYKGRGAYVPNVSEELLEHVGGEQMPKLYNSWSAKTFGALVEVDLGPDADEFTQDLRFKKGMTHELQIVDGDSKPVAQVNVLGTQFPPNTIEAPKASITVIGLRPDEPRFVAMLHKDRKLGKALTLTVNDPQLPTTVKLEPCATLNGRIVDEDGQPAAGMSVSVSPTPFDPPRDNWGRQTEGATTDDDGRFSVLLPPGCPYYVSTYSAHGPNVTVRVKPKAGLVYDVGDLTHGSDLDEESTSKLAVPGKTATNKARTYRTESQRIKGQVLGPDGKGHFANLHVVSSRSLGWMRQPQQKTIINMPTDSNGEFDFVMDLPERDTSIELGDSPGVRVEQIVATCDGFGPAISDVVGIRNGEAVTLKLPADDVPIEGRILNLEGEPVANAKIRIATLNSPKDLDKTLNNLRRRAGEKPQGIMLGMFKPHMAFEQDTRYLNERIAANQLRYSKLTSTPVTTDNEGRFRIDGIGRDRTLALELSGPGIVTSWISVVSRDIEPIGKGLYIGGRTDRTYGANFTLSAEPEQVIEGRVTDVDTGRPIAGITIEPPDNTGFARSTTDADGRYRLQGMPKQDRHHLDINPGNDAPYFARRRVEVKEFASGLQPTTLNFQLKKTTWIEGTVRDKVTGKPVQGRVMFSPHLDSKVAESYSLRKGQYIDPIRLKIGANTDQNGNFRVRAVPGEGVLAVVCKERSYCPAHGVESLADKWVLTEKHGRPARLKAYHTMLLGWMHGYKAATAKVGETVSVDLEVDSGNSLSIHVVDPSGEPLHGVHVRNRFPLAWNSEGPQDNSSFDLLAINPKQPRSVVFYHPERNLGAFLLANQSKRHGERTVTLEVCGVVKGRLLSKNGKPITNVGVGIKPVSLDNDSYEAVIPYAETDKDGSFEIARYTPGTKFSIHTMYGREPEVIAESVQVKPREVRDLGTITLAKTQSRPATPGVFQAGISKEAPKKKSETKVDAQATQKQAASSKTQRPLVFAGQVLLPNGQPAENASIYHAHWYASVLKDVPVKAITKTDSNGRFQYERKASPNSEAASGSIFAKLEGYGFAWAVAPALETSGQIKAATAKRGPIPEQFQRIMELDRGPMRLVPDNAPISGRILDLEGNGIAGVSISVTELFAGIEANSNDWDRVINSPNPDYLTVQNSHLRSIRGPMVPSLFGKVATDANGRFTLRGLGKYRIAKLAIQGGNIVAASVYCRTTGGPTVTLPMQAEHPNRGSSFTFHGSNFSHVAEPSRPVVGQVTAEDTGLPVAGVVITSQRTQSQSFESGKIVYSNSGSEEAIAITDADGQYRLNGLPRSKTNGLVFTGPTGSDFRSVRSQVDTAVAANSPIAEVKKDFALPRGIVVEGRVTDAKTGEGVVGEIRFLQDDEVGGLSRVSARMNRSKENGRFRILVPKAAGLVAFKSFQQYRYKIVDRPEKPNSGKAPPTDGVFAFRVDGGKNHAYHRIEANQAGPVQVDFSLQPSPTVKGVAVDEDGNVLDRIFYVGKSNGYPRWTPSVSGEITLFGLDAKSSRRLAIIHRGRKLATMQTVSELKDGFKIQLKPWATVKGRIIDKDGDALSGVHIRPTNSNPIMARPGMMPDVSKLPLPLPPSDELGNSRQLTDSNGEFEIEGLAAGYQYNLVADAATDQLIQGPPGELVSKLVLKPQEVRDLGDVALRTRPAPVAVQSVQVQPSSRAERVPASVSANP